jgi:RNA polymerase sigma factor (sigma-70 family)
MQSLKTRARRENGSNRTDAIGGNGLDEKAIAALVTQRARFHRFVASRVGDAAAAEDVLQESLLRVLQQDSSLRRGESVVAWFYRILRNAIADHYRKRRSENGRLEKHFAEILARGEDVAAPPADWDAAVCACFRGLLPSLKPRYADVIRRVDLRSEGKVVVARDLNISRATMDVLLHRARGALRERLEVFCGACSRDSCVQCFCAKRENKV